jgi:hypothetical protein
MFLSFYLHEEKIREIMEKGYDTKLEREKKTIVHGVYLSIDLCDRICSNTGHIGF